MGMCVNLCGNLLFHYILTPLGFIYCWLFIELGCPGDLGRGWRGDLGTFMISRPI